MKYFNIVTIIIITMFFSGCALTGGSRTSYGGKVKLPKHGNYSSPSQVQITPQVPIPGQSPPELSLEELYRTFYAPYAKLFTASLSAIDNLHLNLSNFNSTSGIIEFKTIQGQTFFLKVQPDAEFNSRSTVKIFTKEGSRKISRDLVNAIFGAINYQVNNR